MSSQKITKAPWESLFKSIRDNASDAPPEYRDQRNNIEIIRELAAKTPEYAPKTSAN